MKHSYQIEPRRVELGGGWRLHLLEDEEEVGGGVFGVTTEFGKNSTLKNLQLSIFATDGNGLK
ncbi:MAG: hypothetical protein M3Y65_06260 [Pseudomonadota bacterium]|nr:hypothetical protein [Pseudomonadota bacterium]